ncbi:MAG: ABC transporter permease subunit [Planctomycetota bacterium]|nr:ABC transporter permease subunit [Planctomycetota bacterium]
MLGINSGFGEPLHAGWPRAVDAAPAQGVLALVHSPLVVGNIVSGLRLIAGFIVSLLLGTFLGTTMWRWQMLDDFLGPVFLGVQTLPSVCWVPLSVLVFGFDERAILFVLVMGSAFGIAISMRDGLRTIPPLYRRAGQMLGATGWRFYRYVMFPASLPALASSLRSGFSFAWRSLMGAELILATDNHGLGFLLMSGRENANVAQVVAVMIVMILIGMLADRFAFAPLEQRVYARFGLISAT